MLKERIKNRGSHNSTHTTHHTSGISLIALIITIIVIIILAAIVIGGVFNTPRQASFARFCSDMERIQDSVRVAYGNRAIAVATDTSKVGTTNAMMYKWVAQNNENASTTTKDFILSTKK